MRSKLWIEMKKLRNGWNGEKWWDEKKKDKYVFNNKINLVMVRNKYKNK